MRKNFEMQKFDETDLNTVYVNINGELVAMHVPDEVDDTEDISGYEDSGYGGWERDEDVENG